MVKSGKARYIGASTIFAWQLERLQNIAERRGWTKFVSLQPQYNLIYREEEREILPLCMDRKMAVVPWSPLAGGRCAHPWGTKTARNAIDEVSPMVWSKTDDVDKIVVDNLEQVAKGLGYSMAQTSLAWMLSKPFITAPIVGTTSVNHIEENFNHRCGYFKPRINFETRPSYSKIRRDKKFNLCGGSKSFASTGRKNFAS